MKRLFVRALLVAAILALAGCELEGVEDALALGTVISVQDAPRDASLDEPAGHDDHPLVPEVGWKIVVQLDDGAAVTVKHNGTRRYEPGERVRLLKSADGPLLL